MVIICTRIRIVHLYQIKMPTNSQTTTNDKKTSSTKNRSISNDHHCTRSVFLLMIYLLVISLFVTKVVCWLYVRILVFLLFIFTVHEYILQSLLGADARRLLPLSRIYFLFAQANTSHCQTSTLYIYLLYPKSGKCSLIVIGA